MNSLVLAESSISVLKYSFYRYLKWEKEANYYKEARTAKYLVPFLFNVTY